MTPQLEDASLAAVWLTEFLTHIQASILPHHLQSYLQILTQVEQSKLTIIGKTHENVTTDLLKLEQVRILQLYGY